MASGHPNKMVRWGHQVDQLRCYDIRWHVFIKQGSRCNKPKRNITCLRKIKLAKQIGWKHTHTSATYRDWIALNSVMLSMNLMTNIGLVLIPVLCLDNSQVMVQYWSNAPLFRHLTMTSWHISNQQNYILKWVILKFYRQLYQSHVESHLKSECDWTTLNVFLWFFSFHNLDISEITEALGRIVSKHEVFVLNRVARQIARRQTLSSRM